MAELLLLAKIILNQRPAAHMDWTSLINIIDDGDLLSDSQPLATSHQPARPQKSPSIYGGGELLR